uniref:UDP-N-acetylglucosamine transferase subunit ALG14 n=1 Tax=Neobodo designis TaxID=312471 RepID=A0A7S1KWZ3_NEODS
MVSNLQLFVAGVVCLLLWRFVNALPTPKRTRTKRRRVMVVLGSGGHTSEMFGAIEQLPKEDWAQKTVMYVVSATDKDSRGVAEGFEMAWLGREARVFEIPRAREVGQSYFTSIFTTLHAFGAALTLVFDMHPDTILTNGPGVCIPIVAANILVSTLFINRPRATMTYFESFTCVDHLSLSGKIMLRLADAFTVQWPELAEKFKRKNVHYAGRFGDKPADTAKLIPAADKGMLGVGKERRTCVVTVGSTCFDELIRAVDTTEFYTAVTALGINHLFVQKGRSTVELSDKFPSMLMSREVVEYRPGLPALIRKASLVISHAGAGTILEALNAGVPTVVVPNERLMSNHQLQLAQALFARRHLLYTTPSGLAGALQSGGWADLRAFPKPTGTVMRRIVNPLLE